MKPDPLPQAWVTAIAAYQPRRVTEEKTAVWMAIAFFGALLAALALRF